MSVLGSGVGSLYGMGTVVFEFQSAFMWNGPFTARYQPAQFSSAAVDSTNTPTTILRMGLVMGQITASGLWKQYSATATDGSQNAKGVLPIGLNMNNYLTSTQENRYWGIMVGGCVKASGLIGLDANAREQMRSAFQFDDNVLGSGWFPWKTWQLKTTNYQLLASDNQTLFTNDGAIGEVDLTLPAIANGYVFGLKCNAAQVFKFISTEGANIVGDTLTRSSVSVTAIGGGLLVYTNPAGTQWYVENKSSYNQVVSFA